MSRQDRVIADREEMIRIIEKCDTIHIGIHDGEDIYVIPMNFGYTWEDETLTFYLHGAVKGKKLDLIRENPRVGFQLDCEHRLVEGELPCQFSFKFASVIGKGTMELIEDPQEKIAAMELIMKQYSDREFTFNERLLSIVSMMKLTATEFTGRRAK